MKILLCEQLAEPNKAAQQVQIINYSNQTFDELREFIKQQIAVINSANEPLDFAIILNNKLAAVFPFFEENIVSDFFKELNCASISFFGDKFELTQKYIEYFNTLQQDLSIGIFYAGKKGYLQTALRDTRSRDARQQLRRRRRPRDAEPDAPPQLGSPFPVFFVGPFLTEPKSGQNEGIFDPCNTGCQRDKEYFTNTNGTPQHYKLNGDLTIDNVDAYSFLTLDNGATFDGCGHTITLTNSVPLNNTNAFAGLFDLPNGSIYNLTIRVNTTNVKLSDICGWLCYGAGNVTNQSGINCTIDNCHVYAELFGSGQGGFVGNESFNQTENSKFTMRNCSFTGKIGGGSCGGLVGSPSFNENVNITVTIQDCRFSGEISKNDNGGLFGGLSYYGNYYGCFNNNTSDSHITIQNCCATGDITGYDNAGFIGSRSFVHVNTSAGETSYDTTVMIQNCHYTGNIFGGNNGGITGTYCFYAQDVETTNIITIQNCSFTGNISGYYNSGISGPDSFNRTHDIITIQNCSFSGDVTGDDYEDSNSGIVGPYSFASNPDSCTITINNCIVSGNIVSSRWGGIVGAGCFDTTQSSNTIQNCYSFCNFTINSTRCGGILGPDCGFDASPININNCYSIGTNRGSNSNTSNSNFALVGLDTDMCIVTNCVYNTYYETTAGPTGNSYDNQDLHNTYDNVIGVSNIAGRVTCNDLNTVQLIYAQYECPLHLKVLNTKPYQKQNKNLNVVAAFSICKPIAICNIITFILKNVCNHNKLYIYSNDMKFKSQLYWNNNNAQYNGTLASGTYIIATINR